MSDDELQGAIDVLAIAMADADDPAGIVRELLDAVSVHLHERGKLWTPLLTVILAELCERVPF